MREFRQLQLPMLVAAKASDNNSTDVVTATTYSQLTPSSGSSWTTSDGSTPPTPTFSLRGHSRYSSNSSVASTSAQSYEQPDVSSSSSKLPMPKLAEEISEREDALPMRDQCVLHLTNSSRFTDGMTEDIMSSRATIVLRDSDAYDFGNHLFSNEVEPTLKEQKNGDTTKNRISSRLGEHFPSFSRRRNLHKNDSKITDASLCISISSGPPSTRSSSLASSMFQSPDQNDASPVLPSRKTSVAGTESMPASPIETAHPQVNEPIDRQYLASTPLLPPMVGVLDQSKDEHVQSPLQSPTVAESNSHVSGVSTPADTPLLRGLPSPPLSTKPSIASIHRTRVGTLLPSTEVPPLLITDPNDEWSIKLGHANFTIFPQPYLPDVCDAEAYHKLLFDWEQARTNWLKHRHRTLEHYGLNSTTYKLTEQKWAEIDVEWKKYNDVVATEAAKTSQQVLPMAPPEHSPSLPMPVMHDLKDDGKFPKLGDGDIVGPMKQEAARFQPSPPRKKPLGKFFEDLKLSTAFLRRSGR